ncbi:DUF2489 domain-containing protein [Thalassotalea maritima]|uniref:DUF2489 domain-containing protein n=1 Tax=Thalassotalea maritima TaxID=3242416 RepID=UPI0035281771
MTTMQLVLVIVAVIIILALASYASFLLFRLREQKRFREQAERQKREKAQQRDVKVLESIMHICRAMAEKQCEVSEGSWRLSVLMESLPNHQAQMKSNFPAIFTLYSKINHMPILEARKQLTKKERFKLDLERAGYEEEFESAVNADVAKLLPFVKSLIDSMQKQQ